MKKTTYIVFSFLFMLFSSSLVNAQNNLKGKNNAHQFGKQISISSQEITPNEHIRCFTTEYEAFLKSKYPKRQTTEEFENWLAPLVEQVEKNRTLGRNIQAVYNIPVVIHIVHNGDCIGEGENITDAQAISQINVLNQDYRRMVGTPGGINSTGLATDIEINFVLAKRDPNGNPTNGIDRVQTSTASYDNAAVEAEKSNTIWDPTKYLNMWTFRFSGDLDGVLGYAQFPSNSGLAGLDANGGLASTDGVVSSYDAMGTIAEDDGTFILNSTYNLGRTMTHEVGHWLGLRHIWGDNTTCPLTNTNSDKDYCADTPAASNPNYTCVVVNSCTTNPGNDMIQNYMDYTNDACMDTFTPNQKTRMQTVMANSPRRNTLNASNGGVAPSAGIYFNQGVGKCEVVEQTNCSYIDVNYNVSIIKAPIANAVVTFIVNGSSTATNNVDFQIITPTVTFASGSTTDQILTVRYYNDGIDESIENVSITMSVTGGDGAIIDDRSILDISIIDNDTAPTAGFSTTVYSENFDGTVSMSIKDLDGDTNNWGTSATGTSATAIGFTTNFAFSRSWISPSTALNPDNILFSTSSFTMPATNSNLSFYVGTTQGGSFYLERYSVYLTTVNPSTLTTASLNAITPIINNSVLAGPTQRNLISIPVPSSYNGQTVYFVIRHHNTFDMNWIMLDDILIESTGTTLVQTEVNTATAYQASVLSAGTFYAKDSTTGNVIADGIADAFNYGCTNVSVSRSITSAGASAVNYGSNTANNLKVMAKTITVTPTTNNPSGNASFKFYFTEAEIAAWEAATGNIRTALKVFKGGENLAYTTSIGSFGTNVTLTASTTSGMGGVYYFGTDATLTSNSFNQLDAISLYPNPTKDVLNITVPSSLGNEIYYQVYNNLGQIVKTNNSSQSEFSISTNELASGVYFIKLEVNNASKVLRFIKN